MPLDFNEINYAFTWSVVAKVFNKKRNIFFHNHAMKVYAKTADEAKNDATWLLPKHLEIIKFKSAKPIELAYSYYTTGNMDFLPPELDKEIPFPDEWMNKE